MRKEIEKKLHIIFLQFAILNTQREIIRYIFESLPFFLKKDSMCAEEETEHLLRRTKIIYEDTLNLLRQTESLEDIEYRLEFRDIELGNVITKLFQQQNKLKDILECALKNFENSLKGREDFTEQLTKVKQNWDAATLQTKKLFEEINDGNNEPNQKGFCSFLARTLNGVKILWNLFHKALSTIEKEYQEAIESIKKEKLIYYKKYLTEIRENNSILGAGKWLCLDKYPFIAVILMERLFYEGNIDDILKEMAALFENYTEYLLTQKHGLIKEFFEDEYYDNAWSKQEQLLFARRWLQILTERKEIILKNHSKLRFALEAKKLLYNLKHQFYMEFYDNKKNPCLPAYIIVELANLLSQSGNMQKTPLAIIELLTKQQNELDNKITAIEQQLKNYSFPIGIASSILRLFTENYYYRLANNFVVTADEATQKYAHQDSLWAIKLDNNVITMVGSALSGLMLSADVYSSKWFGASYTFLSSLSNFLLLDLDSLINITDKILIDRRTVIEHKTKLEWLLSLSIMMGVNAFKVGLVFESYIYLIGSYVASSLINLLVGKLFDMEFANEEGTLPSTGHYFAKSVLSRGGFIAGGRIWQTIYPPISLLFKKPPSDTALLENGNLCAQYPKRCLDEATKILGLSSNATEKEVKKIYRTLALKLHPDKSGGDTQKEFIEMTNAKNRFFELKGTKQIKKVSFEEEGEGRAWVFCNVL